MDKYTFCAFVIGCVSVLQGIAWLLGKDGTIFAFTSAVVGAVAGAALGFNIGLKKEPPKAS